VPRLPPEAIRALATVAALPVIARDNDAVYAGYGHVGIHARSTGTRRVVLPGTGAVRELLSGREWPAGTGEITLDLDAGKTAILRCR
jgi:hypothetical protein